MSASRISWRRVALVGGAAVVLLGCAVAAAVFLADTAAARRAIERELSAALDGEVRYVALELRMLPLPGARIRGAALRVPGVVDGSAAVLDVRFALLPLLAGKVRPASIRIEQPVVTLSLKPPTGADAFEAYRAAVGPAVAALVRRAAGATITIAGGRLAVDDARRRVLSLVDLACDASVSGDAITVTAAAASDLWRAARVRFRVAADSLAASGTLEVEGFNAAQWFGTGDPGDALRALPPAIDGKLGFETDGRARGRLTVTAEVPRFTLSRGARTIELGAMRVAGEFLREGPALTVTLRDFSAGELLRGASGVLRTNVEGTPPSFELKADSLDISRWHAIASAMLDAEDRMSAWIGHLSAGILRDISMSSAGVGLHELIGRRAIRVEARVEAASLAVPAAGIEVRNGSGRFQLADGMLLGTGLAGELGRSTFRSGTLSLELVPGLRLRGLGAVLGADLGDALSITRRLLGQREPAALAGVEALAGRAEGKIDYDARRAAEPLVVELARIRATGRHRGAPFPIAVRDGDLRYSGPTLRVRRLDASVGRSTVRGAEIELVPGPEAAIRSASGNAVLVLDELFPWLRSFGTPPLRLEELTGATGTLRVRLARLSGPPARPAAFDLEATIEPDGVRIEAPMLPSPLSVTGGSAALSARTLRLERVAFAAGDARMTVSGTLENYAAAARGMDLEITQGSVGRQGLDWLRTRSGFPAVAMPRAPVEVASARVQWPGPGAGPRAAQGRARLGGAVDAEFDLTWQPGALDLKRLAVKDSDTDATAAINWSPDFLRIAFNGAFDGRTVARALANAGAEMGGVRGEMRAALDLRAPQRSSATGTLEVTGMDLSKHFGLPVTFERVRLEARESALRVHEGRVIVQGQSLEASGTVEGREGALEIDGTVTARDLDPVRVVRGFERKPEPGTPPSPQPSRWDLPVAGRIAIAVESLALGRHSLREVRGSLALAANRMTADVTQARLCGITTSFTAVLSPGGIETKARFLARGQSLADALPCLAGKEVAGTGTYDLDAELTVAGPYASPLGSAAGKFSFSARNGRLHRAEALSRAVALEEVAKRLEMAPSKLAAEGHPYDEIVAVGTIQAGTVRLDRGVFDSPTLGVTVRGDIGLADGRLAVQGLIAPFDIVHRSLRRVPVLGRAFGSLVVVPVSVSGTVGDPEVRVMAAAAVGATLVNLMTVRFLLPINIFDIAGAGAPPKP